MEYLMKNKKQTYFSRVSGEMSNKIISAENYVINKNTKVLLRRNVSWSRKYEHTIPTLAQIKI